MVDHEEVLTGGNVAAEVVRVGQTVHKPATTATPAVAALLQHLKASGFDGSPEHLGLDDTGQQILEYIRRCGDLSDTARYPMGRSHSAGS